MTHLNVKICKPLIFFFQNCFVPNLQDILKLKKSSSSEEKLKSFSKGQRSKGRIQRSK